MKELYKVTVPYASYGIVVRDETVIEAAPIARWMVGKSLKRIIEWVRGKHGTVAIVERALDGK
jgi:hypothetical protein